MGAWDTLIWFAALVMMAGFIVSLANIAIWAVIGGIWTKLLGMW